LNVTVPITGPTPFTSMELMVARAVAAYAVAACAKTKVEMSARRRIISSSVSFSWDAVGGDPR
jgi:hypothetical protein